MNLSEYKQFYKATLENLSETDIKDLQRYFKLLSLVQKPIVSLVIPVFKAGDTLVAHIISLTKQQTLIPYEVLFVDNNADKKTKKILEDLGARVVTQEIQGITPARQKGLENAQGKIILSMDPDTLYEPSYIDKMCIPFYLDKQLVYCNAIPRNYQGIFNVSLKLKIRTRLKILLQGFYLRSNGLKRITNVRAVSLAVRKDALKRVGYCTDIPLASGCDDGLLALQLHLLGKFKLINSRVYTLLPPSTGEEVFQPFPFCNQRIFKEILEKELVDH